MEKEQNQNLEENKKEDPVLEETNKGSENNDEKENQLEEKNPEDKILELEDKLARTFAEMENQRRRFEKEKDEAFEYGGFTLAKEALNLLDNLPCCTLGRRGGKISKTKVLFVAKITTWRNEETIRPNTYANS